MSAPRDGQIDLAAAMLLRRLNLDETAAPMLVNFVRLTSGVELTDTVKEFTEHVMKLLKQPVQP